MTELNLDDLKISSRLIAEEAMRRGYAVEYVPGGRVTTGLLIIKNNLGTYIAKSTIGAKTKGYGVFVATNKYLMSRLFEMFNISTPKTRLAYDEKSAKEAYAIIGPKVVVKPVDTNHGLGVTTNINSEIDLIAAFHHAQDESGHRDVIIQEKCNGVDFRLLVVGGDLVAASYREPAYVVGDGESTILQLIEKENTNPARGIGHKKPMSNIRVGGAEKYLSKNSKKITLIPAIGEKVLLSDVANLSKGGSAIDVTDMVHEDIKNMAIEAAKIAGLGVCGVDIMCTDISANPKLSNPMIIELNECPGIRMHHFPSVGKSRNIASVILDQIIEEGPICE